MECKFLSNGIALQYHDFLKPCCTWRSDDQWRSNHTVQKVSIVNWHQHPDLVQARQQLADNVWPKGCEDCRVVEEQGRADSIRLGGASAYANYSLDDITLEIRPGNVCNFACQTCWTPASTRVADFYKRAGLADPFKDYVKNTSSPYDSLLAVKDRLKNIIVLGGEPFYDPSCLEFWQWSLANTRADLSAFTNGSVLRTDLLANTDRKFTLIYSLDAVGHAAEYIRFGTIWSDVQSNFDHVRKELPHVEVRVNITTSVYNYYSLLDVVSLLAQDWPKVVSFGIAAEDIFTEAVIPTSLRPKLTARLAECLTVLDSANIESDQKSNAVNAVTAIINNLNTVKYNRELHEKFVDYVTKIDRAKNAYLVDYCPEVSELLDFPSK
jgi:hypothetical protein